MTLNSAHSNTQLASPDHKPLEKKVSVLSNTSEVLRASSPQLSLTNWKSDTFESSREGEFIISEGNIWGLPRMGLDLNIVVH